MNKVSTVNQVKEHNIELVRNALRRDPAEFTKHSIARETGLSIATVNNILNALCEAGEIVALGSASSTIGRPAVRYAYNKDYSHICCMFPSSAGSQQYLSYAVYDLLGTPLKQRQVWLEDITYEDFENLSSSLLKEDPCLNRFSIGIPGYCNDRLIQSCTMTNLNGCDLAGRLSEQFPCEFLMENNMNAIAYGLYDSRKQQGHAPAQLVVISFFEGSGPGSGIILDGEIYRGKSNFAGEVVFLPYPDGNIYDLIRQGPKAIVTAAAQAVAACTIILNPEICVLTGENLSPGMCDAILAQCKEQIPALHLPALSYVANYNQYYQNGLFRIALESSSI
ncbi:MAG: ROK family protein [Lachnospiraceae bacterium]|nr:ROK family protein [Lachnospiraceae bacterium]